MQPHGVREYLHPADLVRRLALAHAREDGERRAGAARAGGNALGALGLRFERLAQRLQAAREHFDCVRKSGKPQCLPPREAGRGVAEYKPQVARRLVQAGGEPLELGRGAARGAQLGARVARELHELRGRDGLAEEEPRGFRQLVRLVEHHGIARRQELRNTLVAQHDVGEEEVMIDHHHVGGERIAPRAHYEAVAEIRARLPQAVVSSRGGVRPDRRVFRHLREVRAVPGRRHGSEAPDML